MKSLALGLAVSALVAGPLVADENLQPNAKGEAELAKLLSGRIAGAPEHCISSSAISSFGNARIIEGTAIVYDEGRTIYVNRPHGNLDTLQDGDTLVSEVWGGQHCSLDRVRTLEPGSGFPHSYIILGDFVPYTRSSR